MVLSHSVRDIIPLKSLIKEVEDNLGMDSKNLKFVSSYTVYEENNGFIVLSTSTSMTLDPKHMYTKYSWFRKNIRKEYIIQNIEYENHKAEIFTKYFKVNCLSGLGTCYLVSKPSDEKDFIKKWNLRS